MAEIFEQQNSVDPPSVSLFVKQEMHNQIANRKIDSQIISWNWYDTWQEEHHRAFVVAKMCKADLLQEVHDSLQKAIDEGQNFEEWKNVIIPKLQDEWIGKKIEDLWNDLPADEKAKRQPPSRAQRKRRITSQRLEMIYRTNMMVAHAAGQYRALIAKTDLYPYWQYRTQADDRVRDSHSVLDGMVFRYDDPIWNTHFPPNGWRCRCHVRCLDDDELKELGLVVTDSSKLSPIIKEENARGEVKYTYTINGRKIKPERGWNYNPGNIDYIDNVAKAKLEHYEPFLAEQFANDLKTEKQNEATKIATAIIDKLELDADTKEALLKDVRNRSEQARQKIPESQLKAEGIKMSEDLIKNFDLDELRANKVKEAIVRVYVHNEKSKESHLSTGKINGSHNILAFLNEVKQTRNLDLNSLKVKTIEAFPGVFAITYQVTGGDEFCKTVFLPQFITNYYKRCAEVIINTGHSIMPNPTKQAPLSFIGFDSQGTQWSVALDLLGNVKTLYPVN